jgi:hypothetical protein
MLPPCGALCEVGFERPRVGDLRHGRGDMAVLDKGLDQVAGAGWLGGRVVGRLGRTGPQRAEARLDGRGEPRAFGAGQRPVDVCGDLGADRVGFPARGWFEGMARGPGGVRRR